MTTIDSVPQPLRSGIDRDALDPATRPQDDLFRHVNGRWINSHVIPADRARDGAFHALRDQAEEHVKEIILEAGRSPAGSDVADASAAAHAQVGALYASFMDTDRITALGGQPLELDLGLIQACSTKAELTGALGTLQRTGAGGAVGFWVDNDAHDPEKYVVYLMQGGLGLPDESYYREEQFAEIRAAYGPHIARMLTLGGYVTADAADAAAARVVALETAIASHHWDMVRDRDADLTYNPTTLSALAESASHFDWEAWTQALRIPEGSFEDVVVREPSFLEGFADLWATAELEDWQLWLAYHAISARAPYLSDEFVAANFDFYGRTLTGAEQIRDRWKRGVSIVEAALGESVGQIYVERHFPPTHKAKIERLVHNLIEAYRESIENLDWMGAETKVKALAKLESFDPKIGYPVKWRDYSDLIIESDDLIGNVRRASAFEQDWDMAKIGQPIDRDEWHMTPQTVNAYYNPGMNEIVFPAAILQPPFFDPEAENAVNFGGIGAVIGHEIGHGFDDQGSKYDGNGRLCDWWTEEDRTEFDKRTGALIDQYNEFSPQQLADEHRVNGPLTIGENIGDLGGLSIALKAYRIALGTDLADAPVIDGLTGVQRVLLGWAQVWQTTARDAEAIRLLAIDPHSPAEFRCNGVVRNLDIFHEAFDVQPGDALYLAPAERVRIW